LDDRRGSRYGAERTFFDIYSKTKGIVKSGFAIFKDHI